MLNHSSTHQVYLAVGSNVHNGFWLHYKRLEKGKFNWPTGSNGAKVSITKRELNWLLDGPNINQVDAHEAVNQRLII